MRTRNATAGLILLGFALWYAYLTARLPERTLPNTPGPAFFPWVLTVCLVGLSLILLIQGFTRSSPAPPPPSSFSSARALGGLALFLAYLVALPWAGFLIATPLFFGALMAVAGERRPVWLIAVSVGAPVFLYALFEKIFLILLPDGSLLG